MWLFIYIFWIFIVFVIHSERSKCKQLTIFEQCDSKGVLYLFPRLKKKSFAHKEMGKMFFKNK